MLSLFVTGAIVTASAAYTVSCVRAARREVAAKALRIKDALEWLAWRDPRLRDYDGPGDQVVPVAVDALVVHGCSMVAVPQRAADLFVDVLHPAGCNVVILTGGVGRETPPLWRELAEREMYLIFERSWGSEAPPPHVALPTQGVGSKPVLDGFDLTMPPEKLREFCSEADLFLEIFSARCKERGLLLTFGGNPMRDGGAAAPGRHAKPTIYVETASTHTGTNVEYTQRTLELLGFGKQPNVCVVQQPQLHRRTCLTWEKQIGLKPVGWTVAPTVAALNRPVKEMCRYALGEYQRIPLYAKEKGFCVMPTDFPAVSVLDLE